jgi:hypothetical protein
VIAWSTADTVGVLFVAIFAAIPVFNDWRKNSTMAVTTNCRREKEHTLISVESDVPARQPHPNDVRISLGITLPGDLPEEKQLAFWDSFARMMANVMTDEEKRELVEAFGEAREQMKGSN